MILVDVVFVIELVDIFVVVAVASSVGADVVDLVVATTLVDEVVAVPVAVVLYLFNGRWCSLNYLCCLRHWCSLSRLRLDAPL